MKTLARVVGQPFGEHGDLPRRTTSPSEQHNLLSTTDGAIWAQEFCRITGFADEGWALAWFCNAIMTGFDQANRSRDRKAQEIVDLIALAADTYASVTWLAPVSAEHANRIYRNVTILLKQISDHVAAGELTPQVADELNRSLASGCERVSTTFSGPQGLPEAPK